MEKESNYKIMKDFLIDSLKKEKILRTISVEEALRSVNREDFLWRGEDRASAYIDHPLPLGKTGQTISAPHMVTIMLEEAELSPGMKILEIGGGSGYNAALIAYIVARGVQQHENPLVISVERNAELAEFARMNLLRAGFENSVRVIEGDGSLGYPQGSSEMLYDRIIVTAGSSSIPPYLEKQLGVNGIMLLPLGGYPGQTLVKLRKVETKANQYEIRKQKLMAVMFVPLVSDSTF